MFLSRRDDSSDPLFKGRHQGVGSTEGRLSSVSTVEIQQQIAQGGVQADRQVTGRMGNALRRTHRALAHAHESGQRVAGLKIIFLKGRVDLIVLPLNVQMALAAFRTKAKLLPEASNKP